MYVGRRLAGQTMLDALGQVTGTAVIDGDGWGTFSVQGGSVSVWLTESALQYLYLNL